MVETGIHNFKDTTFSQFTYCDYCTKFMWGISHQGFVCQLCGYVCHPTCKEKVLNLKDEARCQSLTKNQPSTSNNVKGRDKDRVVTDLSLKTKPLTATLSPISATAIPTTLNEDEGDIDKSKDRRSSGSKTLDKVKDKAEQFLKNKDLIKRRSFSSFQSTYDVNNRFDTRYSHLFIEPTSSSSKDIDADLKNEVVNSLEKASSFDTWVREVIDLSSHHKNKLNQARQHASPALNIFTTTPHNFSKFISRITPLRELWNVILSILTWESQIKTSLVVLTFATVCIRPIWVLLLPHLALWYYLINNQDRKSDTVKEEGKGATLLPNLNFVGLSEQLNSNTAQEYALNMQFVQNLMGIHVDLYDNLNQFTTAFLQTNQFETCLYVTLTGFPLSLLLFYLIPINLIVLIVGLTPILANHPLVLALVITLIPRIQYLFYRTTEKVVEKLKFKSMTEVGKSSSEDELVKIVFENQRWWMVLGWSDTTFHNERSTWSDHTGTVTLPPTYCINPLPNYQWKDSDNEGVGDNTTPESGWSLIPILPDQDISKGKGWVYYDTKWQNPTLKIGMESLTRRRAWARTMIKKKDFKPTSSTSLLEGKTKEASSNIELLKSNQQARLRNNRNKESEI